MPMSEKKDKFWAGVFKPKELKLIFTLVFLASVLLNFYLLAALYQKGATKSAQSCASSQFIYCINGKCESSSKNLSEKEARKIEQDIKRKLKEFDDEFYRMQKEHERFMNEFFRW